MKSSFEKERRKTPRPPNLPDSQHSSDKQARRSLRTEQPVRLFQAYGSSRNARVWVSRVEQILTGSHQDPAAMLIKPPAASTARSLAVTSNLTGTARSPILTMSSVAPFSRASRMPSKRTVSPWETAS